MESYKERLRRLTGGPPIESLGTLTNGINIHFIDKELRIAYKKHLWSLLLLGIYAVIETIAEALYGNTDIKNIRKYHKTFVDTNGLKCDFSSIVKEINEWRNVLAHVWVHKKGHYINFDPAQKEGWERERGVLSVNPKIYFECFVKAFETNGKIWEFEALFSKQQLEDAKSRVINKFIK